MKELSTREKIIQQSAELFNIYGYHGCSLSHIMEATKLKKGGIYNHFKNKDEIAVEAFNYNYNRMLKRFRDRLDYDKTCLDKLYSVIDVYVSLIDDPLVKGGGCPIFNTAMDSTNTHPELKKKAQEGIKSFKKYVEIKLEEGVRTGEFRSDINIKEVSTLIIATLEGAIIMSRIDDNRECVEFAASYLKNYVRGLLPPLAPPLQGGELTSVGSPPDPGGARGGGEIINNRKYLKQRRRELRNNMTTAEATLWKFLKERQLEDRKFRRQHSVGNYILDFYCPKEKLAVELDGMHHFTAAGYERDKERDKYLENLGIRVLRFENNEVLKAIENVLEIIRNSFTTPGHS
ncbi:DUF559 domain-containing protein [Fulvivirga imtechensis]